MNNIQKEIEGIINAYESLVRGIDKEALKSESRAYGGIIRSGKGKLVEGIAKHVILLAWQSLGGNPKRISFSSKKVKIPIKSDYIYKLKDPDIKEYLLKNINKCYYAQKSDIHVCIDNKFIMAVECKAYTENAMMKRILVDFSLLKKVYPELKFVLFQLESQLGGDYSSKLCKKPLGSFKTHTLLSHFDVDVHIITLLKGERDVNRPIHKYFKPLTEESLKDAINVIADLLKDFTVFP